MENKEEVRLPKAVYYQCMWIVKDIDRLQRLDAVKNHGRMESEYIIYEDENCQSFRDEVLSHAEWELLCIKNALAIVPEEYRIETIEGIVSGSFPRGVAHENTWKKWRRIFIGELAKNLNLI
ncbi:MAG: hypothetical protein IKE52_03490 [Mogibacterium sp.]|nr:hypothetical protein [Mogibacterium sp.]